MAKEPQIVITGYGIISSIGRNKSENIKALFSGESGIKDFLFNYEDGTEVSKSGVIDKDIPPHPFFKEHNLPYDRATQLALVAADESMEEANLSDFENPLRLGVIVGTSLGGMQSADKFHTQWIKNGLDCTEIDLLKQYPLHALADVLAMRYGFNGVKNVISTACSSGPNAVGMASDLLVDGMYDVILAGGVDPISRFSFAGFSSLGAICKDQCSPYSASNGINLGEGAAFFVLETFEHAKARGAKIICEFKSYALSADAYHPTAPDVSGSGAARAMKAVSKNTNTPVPLIAYVNGHGTGTKANDHAEIKAWKLFVGDNTSIPLISNKAAVGHCMGAAGAVELAFSIMSIQNDLIPPTLNFDNELISFDINHQPNKSKKSIIKNVVSNSFAFGGNNCSVLVSRFEERNTREINDDDIVVTGIGCIGTGGENISELFNTFDVGRCCIEKIDTSNKEFKTPYRGEILEIDFKKYIPSKILRRTDRVSQLALSSGRQAIQDAGLKITPKNSNRIGVVYGTATGPLESIEKVSRSIIEFGMKSVDASVFPNTVFNAAPGFFSIVNMLKGPTSTVSSGSVSGLNAFIYAIELLKRDQADAIVVLTADEWNDALQIGNEKLNLLTKNGHLPHSKLSTGMILSEGSTAFVLERKSSALQRGGRILAEVFGYSMTSDNGPLCGFDVNGNQWIDCLKNACGEIAIDKIDYYASTSYGIPEIDLKEVKLMRHLDSRTAIRSIPALLGAQSGSLGTYGLLSCIYSLINDRVPKTQFYESSDTLVSDLMNRDPLPNISCAAVSAASFGGAYATIIIGKTRQ